MFRVELESGLGALRGGAADGRGGLPPQNDLRVSMEWPTGAGRTRERGTGQGPLGSGVAEKLHDAENLDSGFAYHLVGRPN